MLVLAWSWCMFDCDEPSMCHALYRLLKPKISDGRGSKCEATIMKRLAWLVEQLVVSSHEFFFYLVLETIFKTLFIVVFTASLFVFVFIFFTTSFIFFSNLFSKPLSILFLHRRFHRLFHLPLSRFPFLLFPFLFLILFNKEDLLT